MFRRFRNYPQIGGAKMPTARDYVQDGLIHQWDSIEVGSSVIGEPFGHFDCLKTGLRFSTPWWRSDVYPKMNDNGSIGVSLYYLRTDNGSIVYDGGDFTFENVATRFDVIDKAGLVKNSPYLGTFNLFDVTYPSTGYWNVGTAFLESTKDLRRISYSNGVAELYRRTGNLTRSCNINPAPGSYITNFNGGCFSMRLYNRLLTDEEKAHNEAIDKVRFGIE